MATTFRNGRRGEVVQSREYFHEDVCGLQNRNHTIAKGFHDSLVRAVEILDERFGVDVDMVASGCPGCFVTDSPVFWWVAQTDDHERLSVNYGDPSGDLPGGDSDLREALAEAANEKNVPYTCVVDNDSPFILGVEGEWDNYEVGTRVRQDETRYNREREGVVLDSEWFVDSEAKYEVREDSYGRELIAKFPTREAAEEFIEGNAPEDDEGRKTWSVREEKADCQKDGSHRILFDGDDVMTLKFSAGDLTALDDEDEDEN